MRLLLLAALALAGALPLAHAHDSWISRGGHRNAAGEWCCGEGDCFIVHGAHVTRNSDGAFVLWSAPAGGSVRPFVVEVIPESDAQPSPDGAYWRCKRPDGSRRCFFAPPPTN
jgi:hypothetical protein